MHLHSYYFLHWFLHLKMLSVIQDAYVPNTISEDLEYSVMEKWFAAAALICMIQLRVSCVRIIILLVKYNLYFHTS